MRPTRDHLNDRPTHNNILPTIELKTTGLTISKIDGLFFCRLPDGFQRCGYDADTNRHYYRDNEGRYYQSAPGNKYRRLEEVNDDSPAGRDFRVRNTTDDPFYASGLFITIRTSNEGLSAYIFPGLTVFSKLSGPVRSSTGNVTQYPACSHADAESSSSEALQSIEVPSAFELGRLIDADEHAYRGPTCRTCQSSVYQQRVATIQYHGQVLNPSGSLSPLNLGSSRSFSSTPGQSHGEELGTAHDENVVMIDRGNPTSRQHGDSVSEAPPPKYPTSQPQRAAGTTQSALSRFTPKRSYRASKRHE